MQNNVQNNDEIKLTSGAESLISELIGSNWRTLPENELNGALGIAIVYAVLRGCPPIADRLADYLGVDRKKLEKPLHALSINGAFLRHKFNADRSNLEKRDKLTWLYYAGYASEATGIVSDETEE